VRTKEIVLRPFQFCNLSEVIVRADDSYETLKEKVARATLLGTIQSAYSNLPYLSEGDEERLWEKNTSEERLLGVSLTGIQDNKYLADKATIGEWLDYTKGEHATLKDALTELRRVAVEANAYWADQLGIEPSVAVTCVKPSGTVSQLADAASGIHARFSKFYIRTVRGDNKDPLTQFLKDSGFPSEPCVMKPESTTVFSFPMKAPEEAVFRDDRTPIEELELWLKYYRYWCEHKPSITVFVEEKDWDSVRDWVYDHFNEMSGVSFLPYDGGSYQQAPYQEVDKETYNRVVAKSPVGIDWKAFHAYEKEDTTTSSQTLACSGSSCEIVDIAT
jgi:ribonucleoside-triphosphate reductase (thioredoxin)